MKLLRDSMKIPMIVMVVMLTGITALASEKKISWDNINVNCNLYAGLSAVEGASLRASVTIPLHPSAYGAEYGNTDGSAQVDLGPMIVEYRISQSGGIVTFHTFLLQAQSDGSLVSKGYSHSQGFIQGPNNLLNNPSKLHAVNTQNVDMFSIDRDMSIANERDRMKKNKDAGIIITDVETICKLVN